MVTDHGNHGKHLVTMQLQTGPDTGKSVQFHVKALQLQEIAHTATEVGSRLLRFGAMEAMNQKVTPLLRPQPPKSSSRERTETPGRCTFTIPAATC